MLFSVYASFIAPAAMTVSAQQALVKTMDQKLKDVPDGLKFRLSEGVEGAESRVKPPLPSTDPLSESEAKGLLKRIPEIKPVSDDKTDFAKRIGTLPAPKTGNKIPVKFPSDEQRGTPKIDTGKRTLEVIRFSPEGEIALATDLSVTFSQPMVAVSSQEQAAQYAPVELTPQVEGRWRWLGTKTLMFDTDKRFPMAENLGASFRRFIATDLAKILAKATPCGAVSGGSSGFFRPKRIVADRVMLIGDAANQADPLNGGGIHKAMESAWCAAEACRLALAEGDCALPAMRRYEMLWSREWEADWRTAELFMSIAKNPALNDFSLFMLRQMGKLTMADPKFRNFAGGIFSGVISQSSGLVPRALYDAFPKDPEAWLGLLKSNGKEIDAGIAAGAAHLAYGTMSNALRSAVSMARSPVATMHWGMDLAAKAAWLAERRPREMNRGAGS